MKNNPILLVAGEPNGIFLEIFFKAIKKNKYKSPLVLICCKENFKKEMKKFKFKKNLKILEMNEIKKNKLDNKQINIINVDNKSSSNKKLNGQLTQKYIKQSIKTYIKQL